MKCLNCDNEAIGRSKYCSDKCKVVWNRNKRNTKTVTVVTEQPTVTPDATSRKAFEITKDTLPANFGQPDCECWHCRSRIVNKSKNIINHGPAKTAAQLMHNEVNRVSLPGDVDYDRASTFIGLPIVELPPDDDLFADLPAQLRVYADNELGGDDYRQLIYKLKTTSIEQLKGDCVFIPCWRYEQEKQTSRKGFNE